MAGKGIQSGHSHFFYTVRNRFKQYQNVVNTLTEIGQEVLIFGRVSNWVRINVLSKEESVQFCLFMVRCFFVE